MLPDAAPVLIAGAVEAAGGTADAEALSPGVLSPAPAALLVEVLPPPVLVLLEPLVDVPLPIPGARF